MMCAALGFFDLDILSPLEDHQDAQGLEHVIWKERLRELGLLSPE